MNDFNWDDLPGSGSFTKFAEVGDQVSGTITDIRAGQDFNGNPCAVLDIETSNGPAIVTCAQANLKAQIKQLRPKVGQTISIAYVRNEKAEKGTKKVFDIKVSDGIPF